MMKFNGYWIFLALFSLFSLFSVDTAQADGGYIWWEGEKPLETNFPASTWFSTGAIASKQQLFSGGEWLTNDGKRRRLYLWLDGNASFFGSYSQSEQLAQRRGEIISPPKLQ